MSLVAQPAARLLVNDHHRTTERHTTWPAGVSLAELHSFLEIALGGSGRTWASAAVAALYSKSRNSA